MRWVSLKPGGRRNVVKAYLGLRGTWQRTGLSLPVKGPMEPGGGVQSIERSVPYGKVSPAASILGSIISYSSYINHISNDV